MRTIQSEDEGAVRSVQPAGGLPTIRLATILGLLATAALLGVVSATAGLGVAGWIAGLATGSAATALLVTARMRSDQPATPRPAVADKTPSRAAVATIPRIVASRIVGSAPLPASRVVGGAPLSAD